MQSTCQFCHQPTLYIYRDIRNKNKDINLVNCCKSCSLDKDYLTISTIKKETNNEIISEQ